MSSSKITKDDIKAKLAEIQGEAATTVAGAKSQLMAVAAGVGAVLVIAAFFVGRRGGQRRSTVIEVRRA